MNDTRLHHQADNKENIIITTLSLTTLSYSFTEPALRSPVEEWQPYAKQSESTTEWWYLTALSTIRPGTASR